MFGQNSNTVDPCSQGSCQPTDTIPTKPDPNPSDSTDISVQLPGDPNEIIGTRGYDALGDTLQWVAATASLPYTIYFENDPELATAAAQKVEVRHRLHTKADISTFAIGAFGFGSHVFTVEGNRSSYQQRLDLTQDMGIYVDVVAGIDIVAGEAFWILQSIDPATGLPPQGTQQGFLPVNDENHSGEGYVSFTIKPKANACITGDELTASASIVFDINEAIPTNVWHNTVDALPPTTQLTGEESYDNEVLLHFSGQDDPGGCGIKQYKLYVSDNYRAYSLYETYPAGSEAIFPTEYGHCYRFFCLGEDNVGNVEEMKEAEVEFGGAVTTQTTDFFQGWNWWSSFVNLDGYNSLGMLENALGSTSLQIKSQSDFAQYLEIPGSGGYWFGIMDTILSNKKTYLIENAMPCQVEIIGTPVSPADHPITIQPGWNWIGFPSSNAITFADAFANITPNDGDQVKSQNGFSQYMVVPGYSGIWYGGLELQNLIPGMGLMYKSMGIESQTLVYPSARRASSNVTTVEKHWTNNVHAYPGNMTLVAVVELDDVELSSDRYELAAFANGECRGSAKLTFVEPVNRYMAFLTISGGEATEISFGLYDSQAATERFDCSDILAYSTDAIVGKLDEPMIVRFNGTNSIDEIERNLHIYPNPVSCGEHVSITLSIDSKVHIEIIDALGTKVFSETTAQAPAYILAPSTPGVFTIRITVGGKGVYNRKLIVK